MQLTSGGGEDGARTVLGGSLALEHLVLLLCGLTDNLGRKRTLVQLTAGSGEPCAPHPKTAGPAPPQPGA